MTTTGTVDILSKDPKNKTTKKNKRGNEEERVVVEGTSEK